MIKSKVSQLTSGQRQNAFWVRFQLSQEPGKSQVGLHLIEGEGLGVEASGK